MDIMWGKYRDFAICQANYIGCNSNMCCLLQTDKNNTLCNKALLIGHLQGHALYAQKKGS